MSTASAKYVPALGYRWLTPLYDGVVRYTTREATFKQALLAQADLRPGHEVLDLACGTGTLALMARRREPAARITGLDGDPEMLERAHRKAGADAIRFDQGDATALPYAEARFDRVLTSLFFHHLDTDAKRRALAEAHRVLKPGGELHVADWGKAASPLMRFAYFGIQLLDGLPNTRDNVRGLLPDLITGAGFADVLETQRFSTMWGTLSLYRAVKAAVR